MDTFEEFCELFEGEEPPDIGEPEPDLERLYGDYQLAWAVAVDVFEQGGKGIVVPWDNPVLNALALRRGRGHAAALLGVALNEVEKWLSYNAALAAVGEEDGFDDEEMPETVPSNSGN